MLVLVAALINYYVPLPFEADLVQAASAFYIVAEMGSINKNAEALGDPVFSQFKQIMRYFQSAANNDDAEGPQAK